MQWSYGSKRCSRFYCSVYRWPLARNWITKSCNTHRHLGRKSVSKSSEIKCGLIYHPARMKHWTVLRQKLFLKLLKTWKKIWNEEWASLAKEETQKFLLNHTVYSIYILVNVNASCNSYIEWHVLVMPFIHANVRKFHNLQSCTKFQAKYLNLELLIYRMIFIQIKRGVLRSHYTVVWSTSPHSKMDLSVQLVCQKSVRLNAS